MGVMVYKIGNCFLSCLAVLLFNNYILFLF
jgi:hypothetical protein